MFNSSMWDLLSRKSSIGRHERSGCIGEYHSILMNTAGVQRLGSAHLYRRLYECLNSGSIAGRRS
jgi:hypothetical protein